MKQTIYLDNAATTKPDPEVLEAMLPFLRDLFANPSSGHTLGRGVKKAIEEAREKAADLLDTEPKRIVFTSGGSEANNLVIRGLTPHIEGRRIIVTQLEHPSVTEPARLLEEQGYEVVSPSNDSTGKADLGHLEDLLVEKKTALLSVIHGSNEVGTVQDVKAMGDIVRSKSPETWFHLDAVQSVGYLPIEASLRGVDSFSLSAHKLHGPKGAGLLALYRSGRFTPVIAGGGQEDGIRSGTENAAGIVGTVEALSRSVLSRPERVPHVTSLREKLRGFIENNITDAGFNGERSGLPHILSVSFAGLLGDVLLRHLERDGIMASSGSACHSGKDDIPDTHRALGTPARLARGTIRFSFSHHNTPEEIDSATAILSRHTADLREIGIP